MIYIDNRSSTDAHYNLALEEHLFRATDLDGSSLLMFWQNHNTVVLGRYQNIHDHLNLENVRKYGVNIARRITGGGAVYQDLGNLNYSIIIDFDDPRKVLFKELATPILKVFRRLGVPASLSGRNDIVVDGRKISGTAFTRRGHRVLFHGTLFFDTALDSMAAVLDAPGRASVSSRLANCKPHLKVPCDIPRLKQQILRAMSDDMPLLRREVTDEEHQAALALRDSKYQDEAWVYGTAPPADYGRSSQFSCGEVSVRLGLEEERITRCRIFGNFFGAGDLAPLEEKLAGLPFQPGPIDKALSRFDLELLCGGLTKKELMSCFFPALAPSAK